MEKKEISHDDVIALLKAIDELPKVNAQLPTKFYYALTKNRRPLHTAATEIEEVMNKIFKDWADEDNDAKEMVVPKHLVQDYNDEIKDFLRDKTEFEFYQYSYKDLEKEMPSLKGVAGLQFIMEFIVRDDSDDKGVEVKSTKVDYEPRRKPSDKKDPRGNNLTAVKDGEEKRDEMSFEGKEKSPVV